MIQRKIIFVIGGVDTILTSSDNGTSWTSRNHTINNYTDPTFTVTFASNYFLASGQFLSNYIFSTDGITWAIDQGSSTPIAGDVGGGDFVAVGNHLVMVGDGPSSCESGIVSVDVSRIANYPQWLIANATLGTINPYCERELFGVAYGKIHM